MTTSVSWDELQYRSDEFLASGITALRYQPVQSYRSIESDKAGNYLISLDGLPVYVGEAISLRARTRQQFAARTSTFYKTYLKLTATCENLSPVSIETFTIQAMETCIGRKEIEDFGIVNIPTRLNRFQLDKRNVAPPSSSTALWELAQANSAKLIQEGATRALASQFTRWSDATLPEGPGLYLVKDPDGRLIYVGESSSIAERLITHHTQTYFSALRRHIGVFILNYDLKERNGKKKYFDVDEDQQVTSFVSACSVATMPVHLGRYEVEEFLIKDCQPLLNRKGNLNKLSIGA